ncbi:MAG TPA: C40 family peptidase [Bacillota bacterium]|nr:C40 family peptidase [Bacillota bacterium]
METKELEAIFQKYLGIPYRHGGRDMNGVDCLGLVYLIYRDCGIEIPDNDGREYTKDWYKVEPDRYLKGIRRYGKEVPLDSLKPLDLVYFKMGRAVTHTGIMVDEKSFIHVLEGTRVHISRLNFKWERRLAGARRFIEADVERKES